MRRYFCRNNALLYLTPTAVTAPKSPVYKILVVDDDPDIVELLEFNLKKEGYQTASAPDGRKALDIAADFNPDIILLDVMMPHLDGIATCRLLREQPKFKDTYILFLTARAEEFSEVAASGLILRYTVFGRRLFAIGGNRVAAELAGINIRAHASLVFAGMGLLYGVAGLMLVSRLDSAPPGAAVGLELNVIAAAVIGGTSLLGGRGTVAGALLGAVLMESLANGMSLMNLPSAYQLIAVGLVLLFAVYADIRGRGRVG